MTPSSITEHILALLNNTPPFHQLPETVRQDLITDISIEQFEPGTIILEQGSRLYRGLYLIESGLVRLMDVDQQRLLAKCGEGDFFGAFGLLKGGAYTYEARAVEPTVCAILDKDRFLKLYDEYPDLAAFFEGDLKQYIRRMGTDVDVTGSRRLFSQRLDQFSYTPPVVCPPEMTAQEAAHLMTRRSAEVLLVMKQNKLRGVVTDSSLRRRLIARGHPLDTPLRSLIENTFLRVPPATTLFDAMMRLLEAPAHWLVIDAAMSEEPPIGVISDRDIAHLRGQDPLATLRRLDAAASVDALLEIRSATHELLLRLYRQGTTPEQLGRIMAVLYDRLMIRVIQLVEAEMKRSVDTDERVDLPWVWLRLGSGGRKEMALTTQQHNALIYADPSSDEEVERAAAWFNQLAERVNEDLERCGFIPSEMVARDARWRGPMRRWKRTFRAWIMQASDETLGTTPLFFDLRGLYGEMALVDELKEAIEDALNVQELDAERHFLSHMARQALQHRSPFSFFRRFALERSGERAGTFDIRARGVLPVVDAARVLALEARYLHSTNTFDRLRYAAEITPPLEQVLQDAQEAYQYLQDFRLDYQLRAIELGEQPTNHISPADLTKLQQNLLRNSFEAVAALQKTLAQRYGIKQGSLQSLRRQ